MSQTAVSGPLVTFGSTTAPLEYNPDRGPSAFDQGVMLPDPRDIYRYLPGQRAGQPNYGWPAWEVQTVNQVPSTISAVNIAAAQVPVAGTAMTLVSSSGAGITVGQSLVRADTGATVTGLLAIDTAMVPTAFGQGPTGSGGSQQIWEPGRAISRNLRFTSAGNDSTATATIRGFDIYWFPMVETVTLANAGIAAGKKAFKYILSITPAGTLSGSNLSVGTGDVYGFPLRTDNIGDNQTVFAAAAVFTTFVAADTTSPATATTGDVRGTMAMGTASDGTRRLTISQVPSATNMQSVTGLVGVTQFTNF